MASNFNTSKSKIDEMQRSLRKVAIVTAACGLFLNIVSVALAATTGYDEQKKMVGLTACAFIPLLLSLIWNIANVAKLPFWKDGAPKTAIVFTDLGCFLAFLGFSIANGVIMKFFGGWYSIGANKVMMYTYNSVPWMVCAALHLFIVGMTSMRILKTKKNYKTEATCPDCQRKWHRGDARSKDGAEESLLAARDYDEDADGA
ncbi:MAG: hypothetical protein Q9170_002225 [Blastenia crenularia]